MKVVEKAVGIDIGGTKIAVAAVAQDGSIRKRITMATEAEAGFPRALERITQAIEAVIVSAKWRIKDIRGIGIGCAGPVDSLQGIVHNPYTLPGWDGCDLVTPLRQRFDTAVFLENDADTALLGECLAGAGRGRDPVAMLTFGTGIGGALLSNGRILRGASSEHPELGHILVADSDSKCYCGSRGCLESLASGSAIAVAGRDLGLADAPAVFAAAEAGNEKAQAVIERATYAAGTAAWNLFHTFLPQRLILGGGIMERHFTLFAAAIEQRLRTATQFNSQRVDVAQATLGNDAGIVGAASLVFSQRQAAAPALRPAPKPLTAN